MRGRDTFHPAFKVAGVFNPWPRYSAASAQADPPTAGAYRHCRDVGVSGNGAWNWGHDDQGNPSKRLHRALQAGRAEIAALKDEQKRKIHEYVQRIRNYQFAVEIVHERNYATVGKIFERVNSSATQLEGAEIHLGGLKVTSINSPTHTQLPRVPPHPRGRK